MRERVASFLVPVVIAIVLLYQVLGSLQIAVTHSTTLLVIGVTLAIAAGAGLVAALGPALIRVTVLAVSVLLFLDVTFHLEGVFDHLRPEGRGRMTRDEQRIADIHRIKDALDRYVMKIGPIPAPADYGEAAGVTDFWQDYWDFSDRDQDRDGKPFLDFLIEDGIVPVVPTDPVNQSPDSDPRSGSKYVYFLIPPDYEYAGGTCNPKRDRWYYMLAITDLEDEDARPPARTKGSGCTCLWRDQPNFFQQHFDYVICGAFDVTPQSRARAAEVRGRPAAALQARKEAAAVRAYGAEDQTRVADLLRIREALETYLRKVGPLPTPSDYGEAESSSDSGFWQGYWDVSSEDGDGDGKPFLDFLVEGGTLASVPVDPENQRPPGGDPRGGRQYVYFVVPPAYDFEGGTCGTRSNEWVYMLAITDLRSELTRPPKRISGSGCDCLWRGDPNYFQAHFDYVTCGTFRR